MILSLIVSIFVVFSNDYFHQAEKTRSCFFAINTTKHNFQEAARNFHGSIDTPVSVNDIWRSSSLQKKKNLTSVSARTQGNLFSPTSTK